MEETKLYFYLHNSETVEFIGKEKEEKEKSKEKSKFGRDQVWKIYNQKKEFFCFVLVEYIRRSFWATEEENLNGNQNTALTDNQLHIHPDIFNAFEI